MKKKHSKTLALIFSRPVPSGVKWDDALSLIKSLGAYVEEREGSRVALELFGESKVFHRPHPSNKMDKGAVANLKQWLEKNGVKPE